MWTVTNTSEISLATFGIVGIYKGPAVPSRHLTRQKSHTREQRDGARVLTAVLFLVVEKQRAEEMA